MNTTGYYDPINTVRPILPGGSEAWRFELKHFQGEPAVCDFNKMMLALADACFDDMTREPCDDRDDGIKNKSQPETIQIPVVTRYLGSNQWYGYILHPHWYGEQDIFDLSHIAGYLGITYRLGDTTTFSAGPYDESLGIPVTAHFRKD